MREMKTSIGNGVSAFFASATGRLILYVCLLAMFVLLVLAARSVFEASRVTAFITMVTAFVFLESGIRGMIRLWKERR